MSETHNRPQPLVLIYIPDLFLQSGVVDAARRLQAQAYPLDAPDRLIDRLPNVPSLAVIDLSTPGWERVVQAIRRDLRHVPILAFAPHVDTALRERARHMGCDRVFTRGQFLRSPTTHMSPYLQRPESLEGCDDHPGPLVRQGIEEFNAGEYYECHETLETAWRAESRPCRAMYQAILQLGVALYHLQRENEEGARKVLLRALGKFQQLPDRCQGVDIAALHAFAQQLLQALQEGRHVPDAVPRIHI